MAANVQELLGMGIRADRATNTRRQRRKKVVLDDCCCQHSDLGCLAVPKGEAIYDEGVHS